MFTLSVSVLFYTRDRLHSFFVNLLYHVKYLSYFQIASFQNFEPNTGAQIRCNMYLCFSCTCVCKKKKNVFPLAPHEMARIDPKSRRIAM